MSHDIKESERAAAGGTTEQLSWGVKVLPRPGDEIPYANCLVVEPYRHVAHGKRVLATVEHFTELEGAEGFPWRVRPVADGELAFNDAMALAMAYARRNKVPVILVNHDGLSSTGERRQTDTPSLRVAPPPAGD